VEFVQKNPLTIEIILRSACSGALTVEEIFFQVLLGELDLGSEELVASASDSGKD
jgi:hypothetical protein